LAFRFGYFSKDEHVRIYRLMDECIALAYGLRKSIRGKTTSRRVSK
jgi:hypothetical protein